MNKRESIPFRDILAHTLKEIGKKGLLKKLRKMCDKFRINVFNG